MPNILAILEVVILDHDRPLEPGLAENHCRGLSATRICGLRNGTHGSANCALWRGGR